MAIPGSGELSMATLNGEFGGGYSLSSYYRGGSYVPNIGANAAIPTSGTISLSQFYGAAAATLVNYIIIGAGGSGGTSAGYPTAGCGGGGGAVIESLSAYTLAAGSYAVTVGGAVNLAKGNNSSVFGVTALGGGAGWSPISGGTIATCSGGSSSVGARPLNIIASTYQTGSGVHANPGGQGYNDGSNYEEIGGGGGGGGSAGGASSTPPSAGGSGAGGAGGSAWYFSAKGEYYGGGGGGGGNGGANGTDGGGTYGWGGYGGRQGEASPGSGGNGAVIIWYAGAPKAGLSGGTITNNGSYTFHVFTSSGTLTSA